MLTLGCVLISNMSPVSRTNQVLYFARSSLDQAEQCAGQQQRQQEEAALSHLFASVHSFLNELVVQYQLPPFMDLNELFARPDLPIEIAEFRLLQQNSDSWLASLIKQYHRLLINGLEDGMVNSSVQIITVQSDFTSLFRNWLIELEKTIRRMREHYQEN